MYFDIFNSFMIYFFSLCSGTVCRKSCHFYSRIPFHHLTPIKLTFASRNLEKAMILQTQIIYPYSCEDSDKIWTRESLLWDPIHPTLSCSHILINCRQPSPLNQPTESMLPNSSLPMSKLFSLNCQASVTDCISCLLLHNKLPEI